ncbi:MAG: hypothetical protein AAB584_01525 [Patescibacteria group bacterium]
MKKNNLHNQIIQKRLRLILNLIKEGKDTAGIERETALLVLDVIDALQKGKTPLKDGCNCFIKIEYALDKKIRDQLSEEFEDLLNEMIILDEIGTKFGPDLSLIIKLATKILAKEDVSKKIPGLKTPTITQIQQ